ncbi:MAG: transposase [bacterium]
MDVHLLRGQVNRTSRAWALKEMAMGLFDMLCAGAADRNSKACYVWAGAKPAGTDAQGGRDAEAPLGGHRNLFTHRITNAGSESMNSKIQAVKRKACGFRNRLRSRNAIYFHCGVLSLCPATFTPAA